MCENYIFWSYLVGLLIGGLSGYKIGKYGVWPNGQGNNS